MTDPLGFAEMDVNSQVEDTFQGLPLHDHLENEQQLHSDASQPLTTSEPGQQAYTDQHHQHNGLQQPAASQHSASLEAVGLPVAAPPAPVVQPAHQPPAYYPSIPAHVPLAQQVDTMTASLLAGGAFFAASSQQQEPARINCVVSHPLKAQGAGSLPGGLDSSYWTYPITTTTTLPGWKAPTMLVQRRFRDFVALSSLLSLHLPGYFLPQRPHRNAIEGRRATPKFLEERRSALERYLNRLARHPAAAASEVLKVFLEMEGDLATSPAWIKLHPPPSTGILRSTARFLKQMVGQERTTVSPREATQTARESGDVLRMMKEQVAAVKGVARHAPVTPLERELREEAAKVEEARRVLANFSAKAQVLIEKGQDHANAITNVGKAFQELAHYEQGFNTQFPPGIVDPAVDGLTKVGRLMALAQEHGGKHLALIHDHLAAVPVAQAALSHRERALLTSLTIEADLSRKRGALNAAQAAGPAGFARAQSLEAQVSMLSASLTAAQDSYQKLAERNAEEVVHWRSHMRSDFIALVQEFTLVQIAAAQKSQQIWNETARALGASV